MYELALEAQRVGDDSMAYRLAKSASCELIGSVGNLAIELDRCGLTKIFADDVIAGLVATPITDACNLDQGAVVRPTVVAPTHLSLAHAVLAFLRESPQLRYVSEMIDTLSSTGALLTDQQNVTQLHTNVVDALDDLGQHVIRSQGPAPQSRWGYLASKASYDGPMSPGAKGWRSIVLRTFRKAAKGISLSLDEVVNGAHILVDISHGYGDGLYPRPWVESSVNMWVQNMVTCGDLTHDAFLFKLSEPTPCKVCKGHCPGPDFAYCVDCAFDTDADVCRECGRRSALHADHEEREAKSKVESTSPALVQPTIDATANPWGPHMAMWNSEARYDNKIPLTPWCNQCKREIKAWPSAPLAVRATMICTCCNRAYYEADDMWIARMGARLDAAHSI